MAAGVGASTSRPCVFCQIARASTSTTLIYADDKVVAFPDIHPSAFRHYLVIPVEHIPTVKDLKRSSEDHELGICFDFHFKQNHTLWREIAKCQASLVMIVGDSKKVVEIYFSSQISVARAVNRHWQMSLPSMFLKDHFVYDFHCMFSNFPVSHMLKVGQDLLRRDAPESNMHRFGFHQPPFNSVDHLHLHCLALPFTPRWKSIKYSSLLPFGAFIEANKLLEKIRPLPPGGE